jgi:type IV pilus assembly protein PilB
VVDDQPANLVLVRKLLEPANFEVREARSGAEALAVAQETGPDLILLDMHLPDMHGLDVLRRLRETAWGEAVRVVAMSALIETEDRVAWEQAGCVAAIEKPIAVKTFVAQVTRWLPGAPPGASEPADNGQQTAERFGELLVAHRLITADQLSRATAVQPASGKRLGQVLVEQGALSEDDLAWALSHQLGYPYVFLTPEIIDAEAVRLLPPDFLRERRVLPIVKFGQEMTLAMADPTDQRTVEEVAGRTGMTVKRALALASNIMEMQGRFLSHGHGAAGHHAAPEPAATEAQYLQFHLAQALQQGATEIHFEPSPEGQARVRYRLQGMLVDRPAQPGDLHAAILQHLRTLTDIGDHPVGTAAVTVGVGEVAVVLVAAFLPTPAGEAATVTLYPVHTGAPDLTALGVSAERVQAVRDVLGVARGLVIVGCSDRWLRSTLLHGLVPTGARGKVWALETLPVYRRPTIGNTILRTPQEVAAHLHGAVDAGADLLIADDVGRAEALVAAHEAGRTRMVLAGHPESDVAGILSHVLEVAGSALVASSLRGMLAARAVRLLCPACKQPAPEGSGAMGQRTFVPRGCGSCGFTGFKGRRVLADTWLMDTDARWLLRSGRAGDVVERILHSGSRMREQGLGLVEDGLTSMEELVGVMDGSPWK